MIKLNNGTTCKGGTKYKLSTKTPRRRGKIPVNVTGIFPTSFFVKKLVSSTEIHKSNLISGIGPERED